MYVDINILCVSVVCRNGHVDHCVLCIGKVACILNLYIIATICFIHPIGNSLKKQKPCTEV